MVSLSPKTKFFLITIDEILLVIFLLAAVYYFLPEYFLAGIFIALIGLTLFLIAKYYLVYPVLDDTPYAQYDVIEKTGKVVETVTISSGRIRIGQQLWHARSEGDTIPIGTEVKVIRRKDMLVWVAPLDS